MQPTTELTPPATTALPNHLQLPDKDGAIVTNWAEHAQSAILTATITPRLQEIHPDGQFTIGMDCGIYWRHANPPLDGCKAPDWFYVPGVPPMLNGEFRRSYVLWQEVVKPLLVIEYVSGDGSEERDNTPYKGKFWVYEQAICAAYYAIYEVEKASIELYKRNGGHYVLMPPNAAGRCLVEPLRLELGLWQGTVQGMNLPWLRVWDASTGTMVPTPEEQMQLQRERADAAESLVDDFRELLEEQQKQTLILAEKLRTLGLDPDAA